MGKLENHALALLSFVAKNRLKVRGIGAYEEECGIPRSSLMFLLRDSEGKDILSKVAHKYGFSYKIMSASPYLIDVEKIDIEYE